MLPNEGEMYAALVRRDASYEGIFFVGVRTTGIFCRPVCPARRPKRENVEFFESTVGAERAGYRACRRCKPLDLGGEAPDWVQQLLGELERRPGERLSDADLVTMGIEPARARRYFRERYGMTFHAYQRANKLGVALGKLSEGDGIDGVGLDVGFDSTSGFRDAFERIFGAPPGRARGSACIVSSILTSPLGPLVTAATADGVCLVEFADRRALKGQAASLARATGLAVVPGSNGHLEQLAGELGEYFRGERSRFDVPLEHPGTEFQRSVWNALLEIPYAETRSYEQIAREIGRVGAQRAVGRANGQNRIAILVPCHRVVQKDGGLRGYGGGLWRKQRLLELERGVSAASRSPSVAATRPLARARPRAARS
jgi:AraC family transcriptional regulator of adaptative response/methylated-DNA-[protein]-cysteine methyltransferase